MSQEPQTAPPQARRLTLTFWSILGVTTVLRMVYALKLPLTGDEAYFWEWGRHPAMGYYDHPPLAGWILWLTRQIFGDTVAAVRVPAVMAGTLVVAVIHRFTREVTGSERSAALTGILAMGIPVLSVLGMVYSTDTPVVAAGTLGGYYFHRAVNRGDQRAWIWTGLCFALVLASKFLGFPLMVAFALYLVLDRAARSCLRSRGPYLTVGISLLGIVPVIAWNASNDWVTLKFNFAARHASAPGVMGLVDYVAGQALGLGPVVLFLAAPLLAGTVPVWRNSRDRAIKLPAFLALVPLGGFLVLSLATRVGIHWTGVAVPFLAVALGARLTGGALQARRYLAAAASSWIITLLLFVIPLAPFFLPADWAWPLRPEKINTAHLRKIMGSPTASGERVARVIQDMGGEEQIFVFTRSYALSSLLAFYTPGHPQVTVLGPGSVHGRNHTFWFDPERHRGQNAAFVTYRPPAEEESFLGKRFERWETEVEAGGPEGSLVSVIRCYGYRGVR